MHWFLKQFFEKVFFLILALIVSCREEPKKKATLSQGEEVPTSPAAECQELGGTWIPSTEIEDEGECESQSPASEGGDSRRVVKFVKVSDKKPNYLVKMAVVGADDKGCVEDKKLEGASDDCAGAGADCQGFWLEKEETFCPLKQFSRVFPDGDDVVSPDASGSFYIRYTRYEEKKECGSEDTPLATQASPAECAKACFLTEGCRFFKYVQADSNCSWEQSTNSDCAEGFAEGDGGFYEVPKGPTSQPKEEIKIDPLTESIFVKIANALPSTVEASDIPGLYNDGCLPNKTRPQAKTECLKGGEECAAYWWTNSRKFCPHKRFEGSYTRSGMGDFGEFYAKLSKGSFVKVSDKYPNSAVKGKLDGAGNDGCFDLGLEPAKKKCQELGRNCRGFWFSDTQSKFCPLKGFFGEFSTTATHEPGSFYVKGELYDRIPSDRYFLRARTSNSPMRVKSENLTLREVAKAALRSVDSKGFLNDVCSVFDVKEDLDKRTFAISFQGHSLVTCKANGFSDKFLYLDHKCPEKERCPVVFKIDGRFHDAGKRDFDAGSSRKYQIEARSSCWTNEKKYLKASGDDGKRRFKIISDEDLDDYSYLILKRLTADFPETEEEKTSGPFRALCKTDKYDGPIWCYDDSKAQGGLSDCTTYCADKADKKMTLKGQKLACKDYCEALNSCNSKCQRTTPQEKDLSLPGKCSIGTFKEWQKIHPGNNPPPE